MPYIAGRWNEKSQEYERYELPNGATTYETEMDKEISCASCGKQMIFGEGYTSRQIHTHFGLGYSVCGDCYKKEVCDLVN